MKHRWQEVREEREYLEGEELRVASYTFSLCNNCGKIEICPIIYSPFEECPRWDLEKIGFYKAKPFKKFIDAGKPEWIEQS